MTFSISVLPQYNGSLSPSLPVSKWPVAMIGRFHYDPEMLGKGTNHKCHSITPILVRFLSLPRRCLRMIYGWFELSWPTPISKELKKGDLWWHCLPIFQTNVHSMLLRAGWSCCYFMPLAGPCLPQGRITSCWKLAHQLGFGKEDRHINLM